MISWRAYGFWKEGLGYLGIPTRYSPSENNVVEEPLPTYFVLDQFFLSVDNPVMALRVNSRNVTGLEPSIGCDRVFRRSLVVMVPLVKEPQFRISFFTSRDARHTFITIGPLTQISPGPPLGASLFSSSTNLTSKPAISDPADPTTSCHCARGTVSIDGDVSVRPYPCRIATSVPCFASFSRNARTRGAPRGAAPLSTVSSERRSVLSVSV